MFRGLHGYRRINQGSRRSTSTRSITDTEEYKLIDSKYYCYSVIEGRNSPIPLDLAVPSTHKSISQIQ